MGNESQKDMEHLADTARSMQDNGAVRQLLASEDTKRMMNMLGSQDRVQNAAKAAAAGNPAQLMGMMQQLMGTKEGAELVDRITKQARKSGL